MNHSTLILSQHQIVLLLAGPAASGKTSMAEKIGASPGWVHISEDDVWNEFGHPPEQMRQDDEYEQVRKLVQDKIIRCLQDGKSVVLEFILYYKPPTPILAYHNMLTAHGITFETRVLRPSLQTLLERAKRRGREEDIQQLELFEANARHQLDCVDAVNPAWIVDNTNDGFDESFALHFRHLVERGCAGL